MKYSLALIHIYEMLKLYNYMITSKITGMLTENKFEGCEYILVVKISHEGIVFIVPFNNFQG